jgi:hypothetical protein
VVEILKGTSAKMLCLRHPEWKGTLKGTSMIVMESHRNGWHGQHREYTDLSGSSEIEDEGMRFDVPVTSTRRGAFLTRLRSGVSRANGI